MAATRVAAIPELVQNILANFVELAPADLDNIQCLESSPHLEPNDVVWDVFKECCHETILTRNNRTASTSFVNKHIKPDSASTLRSCRLVCRTWDAIASEILFANMYMSVSLGLSEGQVSQPVSSGLDGRKITEQECSRRLRETAHVLRNIDGERRGLGYAVRRLVLDLANLPCFTRLHWDLGDGSADMNTWDDVLPVPFRGSIHGGHSRGQIWPIINRDEYVRNIVELLRKVFSALHCLDRLILRLPAFGSSWDDEDFHVATCIDLAHLEQVFGTLTLGLRSPAISSYLTDLTLALPTTWHIAQALEALHQGSNTHSCLEHLRIHITDDTGVSGNVENLGSGFEQDENHDGEWEEPGPYGVGPPPSNIQLAWPNRSHQDALWDALIRLKDLKSLAVHATHQLDLSRLTKKLASAPDTTLTKLSALHLARVYVTFSSLARLLVPSRVRRVHFNDLIMRHTSSEKNSTRPDTWTDIFNYMRRYCRHLEFIHADSLTYWSTHPSFRPIRLPGVETMFVWRHADGTADRLAYEWLLRRCQARLGGEDFYPQADDFWNALYEAGEDEIDPCSDEVLDEADEAALERGWFDMGQLRKGVDGRKPFIM